MQKLFGNATEIIAVQFEAFKDRVYLGQMRYDFYVKVIWRIQQIYSTVRYRFIVCIRSASPSRDRRPPAQKRRHLGYPMLAVVLVAFVSFTVL